MAIWEQREDENEKQYRAFVDYRDMGVSRSIGKLFEQYRAQTDTETRPTKRIATLKSCSSRYDWQARVEAWDNAQTKSIEEENAERRRIVQENAWNDYAFMRHVIDKRLATYESTNFQGKPHEYNDLISLMKSADDYVRRAVGLPNKISENKNKVEGTIGLTWRDAVMGALDDGSDTDS